MTDWSKALAYAAEWKKRVVETYGEPVEWHEREDWGCKKCETFPQLCVLAVVRSEPEDPDEAWKLEMSLDGFFSPEDSRKEPSFAGAVSTFDGSEP